MKQILSQKYFCGLIVALVSFAIILGDPSLITSFWVLIGILFYYIISKIEPQHTAVVAKPFSLLVILLLCLLFVEHSADNILSFYGIVLSPLCLTNLALCLLFPLLNSDSLLDRVCSGVLVIAINIVCTLFDFGGMIVSAFTILSLYLGEVFPDHVKSIVKVYIIMVVASLSLVLGIGRSADDVKKTTFIEQTLPEVQSRLDNWKDCIMQIPESNSNHENNVTDSCNEMASYILLGIFMFSFGAIKQIPFINQHINTLAITSCLALIADIIPHILGANYINPGGTAIITKFCYLGLISCCIRANKKICAHETHSS